MARSVLKSELNFLRSRYSIESRVVSSSSRATDMTLLVGPDSGPDVKQFSLAPTPPSPVLSQMKTESASFIADSGLLPYPTPGNGGRHMASSANGDEGESSSPDINQESIQRAPTPFAHPGCLCTPANYVYVPPAFDPDSIRTVFERFSCAPNLTNH